MIVSGDAVRDKHTMPMPRHILCPCPQSPERQPAASRRDAGDGETGTGEFPMAFASSLCWRLRPEKYLKQEWRSLGTVSFFFIWSWSGSFCFLVFFNSLKLQIQLLFALGFFEGFCAWASFSQGFFNRGLKVETILSPSQLTCWKFIVCGCFSSKDSVLVRRTRHQGEHSVENPPTAGHTKTW